MRHFVISLILHHTIHNHHLFCHHSFHSEPHKFMLHNFVLLFCTYNIKLANNDNSNEWGNTYFRASITTRIKPVNFLSRQKCENTFIRTRQVSGAKVEKLNPLALLQLSWETKEIRGTRRCHSFPIQPAPGKSYYKDKVYSIARYLELRPFRFDVIKRI